MTIAKKLEETQHLAAEFAKKFKGHTICLFGEIGSGKTTFTKALINALVGTNSSEVKSPTYTYIRTYKGAKTVHHLDLYRTNEQDHLLAEELQELLEEKDAIIIIEWAEKLEKYLPNDATRIYFEYIDRESRKIIIDE